MYRPLHRVDAGGSPDGGSTTVSYPLFGGSVLVETEG